MKAALSLFALGLLTGCATASTPPASTETPREPALTYAAIGQDVNVGGPRVTPLAVIEDSRCPHGVQCVWAGRVRLPIRVTTGPGAETRDITLGTPIPVADGTLLLADALPARKAKAAIPPGDYRFGFRFDGGY